MQNEHLLLSSAAAEERQLVAGCKCVLELAFATSLKQLMLRWSHVEKDRLRDFVEATPCVCFALSLVQLQSQAGAEVAVLIVDALLKSGAIFKCKGLIEALLRGASHDDPGVRQLLSQALSAWVDQTKQGGEGDSPGPPECDPCPGLWCAQLIVCALTRRIQLPEPGSAKANLHANNRTIFETLHSAVNGAQGVRNVMRAPFFLEPVHRLLVLCSVRSWMASSRSSESEATKDDDDDLAAILRPYLDLAGSTP